MFERLICFLKGHSPIFVGNICTGILTYGVHCRCKRCGRALLREITYENVAVFQFTSDLIFDIRTRENLDVIKENERLQNKR